MDTAEADRRAQEFLMVLTCVVLRALKAVGGLVLSLLLLGTIAVLGLVLVLWAVRASAG